jgi:hypothetical protein
VTVGDRLDLSVSARGGEGWLWGELQVVHDAGGPWEVVDGPRPVRGSDPPAWQVTVAAMQVGELELPALVATVRSTDGETVEVTPVDAPVVNVVTVLAPDDEGEPAPLRDPVGVSGLPWEWVVPGALVVVPAFLLLWWWLRRRRRAEAGDEARILPPFAELEALARSLNGRVGREPPEGVCDQLASGMRRYLERRSGDPAQEMTSFELRLLCRRRGWPEPVQRAVQGVMNVADSIRFGRRRLTDLQLREALSLAVEAGQGLETHLAPPAEGDERKAEAAR